MFQAKAYRAMRLVVMPEWQGAGVGTKFLNWVAEYHKQGLGRCHRKYPTFIHTSHPLLIDYLKRSDKWILKSQRMYGDNKEKNANNIRRSRIKNGNTGRGMVGSDTAGYGGHFRAIQGFKYLGKR